MPCFETPCLYILFSNTDPQMNRKRIGTTTAATPARHFNKIQPYSTNPLRPGRGAEFATCVSTDDLATSGICQHFFTFGSLCHGLVHCCMIRCRILCLTSVMAGRGVLRVSLLGCNCQHSQAVKLAGWKTWTWSLQRRRCRRDREATISV